MDRHSATPMLIAAVRYRGADFLSALLSWAVERARNYPWRRNGCSPYEVLVAELLLKRTTATAAARVYEDFLNQYPSFQALAAAPEEQLAQSLATVGLQKQRAKAIKALTQYLVVAEGGQIPEDLERLLKVPGLGEYSARAVVSFGFGKPVAVVDANVERVLTRVFQSALPERPGQRALQELADALVPHESHREYNFGLLDLGALVCRYVDPLHEECPLNGICDYYQQIKARGLRGERSGYQVKQESKLRQVRKTKGVTLAKLARDSGVSKLTIIKIESGKTTPRPDTLRKLAAALSISPEELG